MELNVATYNHHPLARYMSCGTIASLVVRNSSAHTQLSLCHPCITHKSLCTQLGSLWFYTEVTMATRPFYSIHLHPSRFWKIVGQSHSQNTYTVYTSSSTDFGFAQIPTFSIPN